MGTLVCYSLTEGSKPYSHHRATHPTYRLSVLAFYVHARRNLGLSPVYYILTTLRFPSGITSYLYLDWHISFEPFVTEIQALKSMHDHLRKEVRLLVRGFLLH